MNSTPIYRTLNRFMSIKYPLYKPPKLSMTSNSEFISTDSIGGARIITLKREKALNALDISMITSISNALSEWENSAECRMVIIKASKTSKAFCAGGDILQIAKSRGNLNEQMSFFAEEYSLNHRIATFPKPIISLMDGYTSKNRTLISNFSGWRCRTVHP